MPEPTDATTLLWAGVSTAQGDLLVVLPQDVVEYWLQRMPVLNCHTWGELRTAVTPQVYQEVLALSGRGDFAAYIDAVAKGEPGTRADDAEVGPPDETPFDAYHDIPFHETGDWPPSPQELMSRFLPREVLDQYAFTYIDNRNVSVSVVDWDAADDILGALANLGYVVVEDPRVADLAEDAAMG